MKREILVRDWTLNLILIITAYLLIFSIILFFGQVFNWNFLMSNISNIFFMSGAVGILMLASLVVLNVASNLNILSKTQEIRLAKESMRELVSRELPLRKLFLFSCLLVFIVVGSLWAVHYHAIQYKIGIIKDKVETIVNSPLFEKARDFIRSPNNLDEFVEIKNALRYAMDTEYHIEIIYPQVMNGIAAFYFYRYGNGLYLTTKNNPQQQNYASSVFVPLPYEKRLFDELAHGKRHSFATTDEDEIRYFRRIEFEDSDDFLILFVDTSKSFDSYRAAVK